MDIIFLALPGSSVYNARGAFMSKDPQQDVGQAWGLGFTLVALVVAFTGLGYLADGWLHTRPWLMVAGVFVGAGLGFTYMVYVFLAGSSRGRSRKNDTDEGDGPDERLQ
jgi:F0F1-type ATP synthase assembly protein I